MLATQEAASTCMFTHKGRRVGKYAHVCMPAASEAVSPPRAACVGLCLGMLAVSSVLTVPQNLRCSTMRRVRCRVRDRRCCWCCCCCPGAHVHTALGAPAHLNGTSRNLPLFGGSPLGPARHGKEAKQVAVFRCCCCWGRGAAVPGASYAHPTRSSGGRRGCWR
jgi:hypothetical protein